MTCGQIPELGAPQIACCALYGAWKHPSLYRGSVVLAAPAGIHAQQVRNKQMVWPLDFFNPVKHGIGNQEKVSCLEQPRSNFFKT